METISIKEFIGALVLICCIFIGYASYLIFTFEYFSKKMLNEIQGLKQCQAASRLPDPAAQLRSSGKATLDIDE